MSDLYILAAGLCLTGGAIGVGLYARLRQNRRAQEAERATQAEAVRREAAAARPRVVSAVAIRAVAEPPPDAPVQWTVKPPAARSLTKTKNVLPGSDPSQWPPPMRKPEGVDMQEAPRSQSPRPPPAPLPAPVPACQPPPDTAQPYVPPPLPPKQAPFSKADLRRAKRALKHLPESVRNAPARAPETISERAVSTVTPIPLKRTAKTTLRSVEAHPLRGTKYQLIYRNRAGEVSERKIRFERTNDRDGTLSLMAHCYMQKAPREFRTDRIIEITDAETGLVICDPETFFA